MAGPEIGSSVAGVVLDAVGTLIEPDPPVAVVYARTALAGGLDIEVAEVKRRFQRYFRVDEVDDRLGPLATDEANERRRWRRIVASVLPDLRDPDRAFEELWDHFGRPGSWRTFPDVGPGIAALRESGARLVIASNFDARLRGVLAGLPELAGLGTDPVISSEVGRRKPHRDFYIEACRRLGLPPEAVACVGDDVENDVLGAERAGLRGVLIDRDGRPPEGVEAVASLEDLAKGLPRLDVGALDCR